MPRVAYGKLGVGPLDACAFGETRWKSIKKQGNYAIFDGYTSPPPIGGASPQGEALFSGLPIRLNPYFLEGKAKKKFVVT